MSHDHFAAVREKADSVALVEELTDSRGRGQLTIGAAPPAE